MVGADTLNFEFSPYTQITDVEKTSFIFLPEKLNFLMSAIR